MDEYGLRVRKTPTLIPPSTKDILPIHETGETMVRVKLLFSLIFATYACAQMVYAQTPKRETVVRLKKATVFVRVVSKDEVSGIKYTGSGSGFFVSKNGYVVTNWHVVRPFGPGFMDLPLPRKQESIKVYQNSGKFDEDVLEATVVAVDKEHDLALLATSKAKTEYLELGNPKDIFETSPLWVSGFPLGEKFSIIERGPEVTISKGTVTALRHNDEGSLRVIQTDAQFDSGNSGGPLIDADGKVMGIAQSIIVKNRSLNFAVPVTFATALLKTIDTSKPWKKSGKITIGGPAGSDIYVDGKKLGTITKGPLQITVPYGIHQIAAAHPVLPGAIKEASLLPGTKISFPTTCPAPLVVMAPGSQAIGKGTLAPTVEAKATMPTEGVSLLAKTFKGRDALKDMEQRTGGTNVRTWYVRDGQLHQHESNSILHAIYTGTSEWTDYSFAADVQIKNEQNDSRAGLIFRETPQGFYLFRIHRETDTAQLAYHCKQPFGWFVLGEKGLGVDVTEKPNRLKIFAAGENISCMLNGKLVFTVRDQLSRRGRVGFYSVESKASFDNVSVSAVAGGTKHKHQPGTYPLFWYTDAFSEHSDWWLNLTAKGAPARPWRFSDAGAIAVYRDQVERVAVMNKYVLSNFIADLVVKLSKPPKKQNGSFGFVFGRRLENNVRHEYRVILDTATQTCTLVKIDGEQRSVIATAKLPAPPVPIGETGLQLGAIFGDPISRLILRVDGSTIALHSLQTKLLSHTFEDQTVPQGKFGIVSQGIDAVYHQLTIGNPQPQGKK